MERQTIEWITKWVVGLSLPLILVAFLLGGRDVAIGAVAGAALSVANWMALRWMVHRILVANDRARAVLMLLLVAKMGLVLGLVALMLRFVDAMGFTIGMGALVLGVLVGALQAHLLDPDTGGDELDAEPDAPMTASSREKD